MPVKDQASRKERFGPFLTYVERVRPDGVVARWDSRRHRKQPPGAAKDQSTWWAPRVRGWWIAVLFAVGSLLFALGTIPTYTDAVGARWDAVTFFIGSLFFTTAGFLTYREAVDAGPAAQNPTHRRFFVYQPGRIDWWATSVQLAGTLFFNISTGNAVRLDLSAKAANQHIWRPDALGSICFLVASALAWFEVCHGWTAWQPASLSWWITLLNLVGSIAFGVSAVAGYINPSTGQLHNAERSNLGTFIGAVCFLIGAVLLLPERTQESAPALPTPTVGDGLPA
jgi:hypothetical protein